MKKLSTKPIFCCLLVTFILLSLLLAACQTDDTQSDKGLAALNCQLADIPSSTQYTVTTPITTPPTPELFGEGVINYHLAEFNEQSLAYQTIRCEMIQFEDDAAEERALTHACAENPTSETITSWGTLACNFGVGVETSVFQREEMVVVITADLDGMYARELAQAVDERLMSPDDR